MTKNMSDMLNEAREEIKRKKTAKKTERKEKRNLQKKNTSPVQKNHLTLLERIRRIKLGWKMGAISLLPVGAQMARAAEPSEKSPVTISVRSDLYASVMRWKPKVPDLQDFCKGIAIEYPEIVDEILNRQACVVADSLINLYVSGMNEQVAALRSYKRGTAQHNRLREKIVQTAAGGNVKNASSLAYCLATIQDVFVELSKKCPEFYDLTFGTFGHNGLKCSAFIDYMQKHYQKFVIKTNDITKTMMEKGKNGKYKYDRGTLAWQTKKDGKSMSHMISFDGRAEDGCPLYDAGNRDVNDQRHPAGVAGYIFDTRGFLEMEAKMFLCDGMKNEAVSAKKIFDCFNEDREMFCDILKTLAMKNPNKYSGLEQRIERRIKGVGSPEHHIYSMAKSKGHRI